MPNENCLFRKYLRLPREMRSLFLWGQTQILILEILPVFLWLKFSSSLILTKNPSFRSGTKYVSKRYLFDFIGISQ